MPALSIPRTPDPARRPTEAERAGFVSNTASPHTTRTIMLPALRGLLAACPPDSPPARYRAAVVVDNVLLKGTAATRRKTFAILAQLYALDPHVLVFRALRDLWDSDEAAQPLLAVLCALIRDPTFLATSQPILDEPVGATVSASTLAEAVQNTFPDRFNPRTRLFLGQRAAASWEQAGYLRGKANKMRQRVVCRPVATVYALLLGYLCDERGEALFDTRWAQLLDTSVAELHSQAVQASQQGWLEYRRSGEVTDVSFRHLLRRESTETLE